MKKQTHLVIAIQGPELNREEAAFLRQARPSGVILFGRNLTGLSQTEALIKQIRKAPEPPTIWIDQEGGRVQRLREPLTRYPSPYRFALLARQDAIRAERLMYTAGRLCGEELSALGIGVNCAPVLDIREEGANPVIGERAFGSHFSEVIVNVSSWLLGFRRSGVMAVGKHFPGHGAAQADSHHALPVVNKTLDDLKKWELNPFRALQSHLPGMMTAHLALPEVDGGVPATWSRRLLYQLLRQKWGYEGVIVSDALEMGALAGRLEERARLAMRAGCDLVMCCTGRMEDNEAMVAGISQGLGEMRRKEVAESARRIERVLDPHRIRPGSIAQLLEDSGYRKRRQQIEALAEEAFANDPTVPQTMQ
ncbi:MAG: beta-N-acetylhexosaminidase [Magnetococcales bacterium]|nr:beta-N-acetylhexosaminidase [Magnetococcales bacterium]